MPIQTNVSHKIIASSFALWLSGLGCLLCFVFCTSGTCANHSGTSCSMEMAHSQASCGVPTAPTQCLMEPEVCEEFEVSGPICGESEAASSCCQLATEVAEPRIEINPGTAQPAQESCGNCCNPEKTLVLPTLPRTPDVPASGSGAPKIVSMWSAKTDSTGQFHQPYLPDLEQTYLKCCILLI